MGYPIGIALGYLMTDERKKTLGNRVIGDCLMTSLIVLAQPQRVTDRQADKIAIQYVPVEVKPKLK